MLTTHAARLDGFSRSPQSYWERRGRTAPNAAGQIPQCNQHGRKMRGSCDDLSCMPSWLRDRAATGVKPSRRYAVGWLRSYPLLARLKRGKSHLKDTKLTTVANRTQRGARLLATVSSGDHPEEMHSGAVPPLWEKAALKSGCLVCIGHPNSRRISSCSWRLTPTAITWHPNISASLMIDCVRWRLLASFSRSPTSQGLSSECLR